MPTRELLAAVPLFSKVPKRELSKLARVAQEVNYPAGKVLAEPGKKGLGFFVILEGEARVEPAGKRAKILGPGDYFGEMALIDGGPRSALVTATTDLRCLAMTQWEFRPFVMENPDVAWHLLEAMVQRLREAER